MTNKEIKLVHQQVAKGRIQARLSAIEAEKKFLLWLLSVPLDIVVDEIRNRLREVDAQIRKEQESLEK